MISNKNKQDTLYLDNGATTKIHPKVKETMLPYLEESYGNPSSIHHKGQEAKTAVEAARKKVADLINATPNEIIFTGSGTEGNNMTLKGIAFANKNKGNHIITTKIEHKCILNSASWLENNGFDVTYLDVDNNGIIDIDDLKSKITDKTILVSVMFANNEMGSLQPIKEIGQILKNHPNTYFHTDAVQAAGKIDLDVNKLNVDLLTLSGHKMYAPKGIGALYIKKGTKIEPIMHGGGQENGLRSSTENVAGIIAIGEASKIAKENYQKNNEHLTNLQNKLIKEIKDNIPETKLNGHPIKRLPGNVNISFNYIEGESIALMLDEEGICISTGSACTSKSLKASHVLTAMKIDPVLCHGSIRFSFGMYNTEKDIERLIKILPQIIEELRLRSPLYNKE